MSAVYVVKARFSAYGFSIASEGYLSGALRAAALAVAVLVFPSAAGAQDAWVGGSDSVFAAGANAAVYDRSSRRGSGRGRVLGHRPQGCPPRAWCACWLAKHLGKNNRRLWLARNWLQAGRRISHPQAGAIAVYARGRGGHVGIVKAVPGPGRIVLLSGNDGNRVRERERSTRGIIGYVMVN